MFSNDLSSPCKTRWGVKAFVGLMWRFGQDENVLLMKVQHLRSKLLVGDALCSAYT